MSVALNPKLLEKPSVPVIREYVVPNLEAKSLNWSFVDIDKLNEAMSNAQRVINESAQAFRSYYEHQEGSDKKEISEVLAKTKEVTDSFDEIKQVLNQIWAQVSKDSEKRTQAYDAIIRELGKA